MHRTTLQMQPWRVAVLALVVVSALGAWGCRRRPAVEDARTGALHPRQERALLRLAAHDTGCAEGQLSPQMIQAQPAVYTVLGCTQPVEYWAQCSRRNCRWHRIPHLNEAAAATLSCAPQMIQQQPSQAPNIRYASGCGMTQPFTPSCTERACVWAAAGPPQGAGGPVAAGPPPQQVQVTPGQTPDPTALPAAVQSQREAILSCVDSGTLTLRLRWTADGQVILQLPPELVGTASEGCIQAAIGALRVSAQAAGEVAVQLQ